LHLDLPSSKFKVVEEDQRNGWLESFLNPLTLPFIPLTALVTHFAWVEITHTSLPIFGGKPPTCSDILWVAHAM